VERFKSAHKRHLKALPVISSSNDYCRKHGPKGVIVLGVASFLWFLFRTGSKPSRIMYPCQRAALANSLVVFPHLAVFLLGAVAKTRGFLSKRSKVLGLVLVIVLSILVTEPFWNSPGSVNAQNPNQELQLTLSNRTATVSPPSNIYAVNGRQAATVGNLISLMSQKGLDFYSMIQPNDVVLVKINEEWAERGGTDTDVLKQLIQSIVDHPKGFTGEIVVADNGQWGGDMNWANSNAENHSQSTQKVIDGFLSSHKVSTYDWIPIRSKQVNEYSAGDMNDGYVVKANADATTGIYVSYPKFRTVYGTYISFKYGIWNGQAYENRLKVTNVPVLKSHTTYGVTGAVKHYMGVLSNTLSNGHVSIANGGMGTLMAETRTPALNLMCAIWVNAIPDNYAGAGPSTPYTVATRTNILAASTDPVALDYWASKYILVQAAQAIGYSDTHTLNPDSTDRTGVSTEALGVWLPKARDALLRAGIQVTTNEQQMNIYAFNSDIYPSPSPSPTLSPSPSPSPSSSPSLSPSPSPSPSPNPSTSPTPTPSPSLSPSPSQSSSQQPIPPQKPQPNPLLSAEIIYPIAIAIGTAAVVAVTLLLRRRQRAH
jgi:hypothetical protein